MIKILFFGLGSIGQRHIRIIKKIFKKKNYKIYFSKTSKKNIVINDKLKVYKKDIFKFYKIQNITKKEIILLFLTIYSLLMKYLNI